MQKFLRKIIFVQIELKQNFSTSRVSCIIIFVKKIFGVSTNKNTFTTKKANYGIQEVLTFLKPSHFSGKMREKALSVFELWNAIV